MSAPHECGLAWPFLGAQARGCMRRARRPRFPGKRDGPGSRASDTMVLRGAHSTGRGHVRM